MKQDYKNAAADAWYAHILTNPAEFPFAFTYNETSYQGFSKEDFTLVSRVESEDEYRNRKSVEWTFSLEESLNIKVLFSHYSLHGASEWTVRFINPSNKNSGILSDAHICITFNGSYPMLKGILGDLNNWYRPYAMDLTSCPAHFESNSGRPTHVRFPYFNLEYGDGGVMLAIGWSGTWQADFRYNRATGNTTYTAKSVNQLHTYLKPGEEIRTALFVCAPYTVREENYAVNYWRSWFLTSNIPKADGKEVPLQPFSTCCLASDTGLPNTDGSISERYTTWRPSLEKMIAEDVKVDFRWVDAGWYVAPNGNSPDGSSPQNDWHSTIGTWTLDPVKWPGDTFRQSTDFARANGMKTLLWFEPERICDPVNLEKHYGYNPKWAIHESTNNIGDPDCLAWTLERIKRTLRENRVEMYREDNNQNPGELWHYLDKAEGENRAGITESKVVDAHYRMWDEIIDCTTSYGGCGFVDSCAGGGGRNDLESLRRGVPMLRSDFDRTSTAIRLSMTTSFNKWIPFCGAINKEKGWQLDATGVVDPYVWRASYLPVLNVDSQFVQDPKQDFEVLRTGLQEWKRLNKYLLKDFYVLTHWHTEGENTDFTAYSFFDPEEDKGILLAFRQEGCKESVLPITLPYAVESKLFTITDEDSGEEIRITGEQMLEKGITLTFENPRSARLLWVELTDL